MTPYQMFAVCLFLAHIMDSMTVGVAETLAIGEQAPLCAVDPAAFATLILTWQGLHGRRPTRNPQDEPQG